VASLGAVLTIGVAGLAWQTARGAEGGAAKAAEEVGKPAPAFELKGLDGKTYRLADLQDKLVVLEWFNPKCPFVQGAAKLMSETSAKYTAQGVVWLAVYSTDPKSRDHSDAAAVRAYLDEHGLKYPVLLDENGKVGKAYGAKTTPHMFIINKGTLAYAGGHADGTGPEPGSRNYIAESLDALSAGKTLPATTTPNRGCSIKYAKN
jgi:peroxiredoxin